MDVQFHGMIHYYDIVHQSEHFMGHFILNKNWETFTLSNFVSNDANLASISKIQNEQYKEGMGDGNGEKDWTEFAVRKTDKGTGNVW